VLAFEPSLASVMVKVSGIDAAGGSGDAVVTSARNSRVRSGPTTISGLPLVTVSPVYVRLADGSIRNAYTLHILNKALETRLFELTIAGLPGVDIKLVGGLRSCSTEMPSVRRVASV
jgi:hypothetical protein